jgi:uncharacterized membrane protein
VIEKRFGLGYTFNFARRQAWVFLEMIVLPFAIALLAP